MKKVIQQRLLSYSLLFCTGYGVNLLCILQLVIQVKHLLISFNFSYQILHFDVDDNLVKF